MRFSLMRARVLLFFGAVWLGAMLYTLYGVLMVAQGRMFVGFDPAPLHFANPNPFSRSHV